MRNRSGVLALALVVAAGACKVTRVEKRNAPDAVEIQPAEIDTDSVKAKLPEVNLPKVKKPDVSLPQVHVGKDTAKVVVPEVHVTTGPDTTHH